MLKGLSRAGPLRPNTPPSEGRRARQPLARRFAIRAHAKKLAVYAVHEQRRRRAKSAVAGSSDQISAASVILSPSGRPCIDDCQLQRRPLSAWSRPTQTAGIGPGRGGGGKPRLAAITQPQARGCPTMIALWSDVWRHGIAGCAGSQHRSAKARLHPYYFECEC